MSKTYSEKLRDPRWQRRRLEIMERDGFACKHCASKTETLNVHHRFYRKGCDPWEYPENALVTLCQTCHEIITKEMQPVIELIGFLDVADCKGVYAIISAIGDCSNEYRAELSASVESFGHAMMFAHRCMNVADVEISKNALTLLSCAMANFVNAIAKSQIEIRSTEENQ